MVRKKTASNFLNLKMTIFINLTIKGASNFQQQQQKNRKCKFYNLRDLREQSG